MIGEKPDQSVEGRLHKRGRDHDQCQSQECCAYGVEQSLQGQHGPQLPGRHADGLEYRQLPAAGGDSGEDGVEEVQHPHQTHDEAQGSAQQKEHAPEALKLSGVRGFALIVKLGVLRSCVIRQEGFHGGIGLVSSVEGVVHDAVRASVPDKGLAAHNKLIGTIIAVGEGVGYRHQGGHGVVHIPVLDCPLGVSGYFGHILPGTVNFAGIDVIVRILLHIPDGHRVAQPGPVTVHIRSVIVICAVYRGNIIPVGIAQL